MEQRDRIGKKEFDHFRIDE